MSDSILALQKKINSANDLGSVVRTMKSMAATNIHQYELALLALEDYYRTVRLGVTAYLSHQIQTSLASEASHNFKVFASSGRKAKPPVGVIIIGSDQGLVGQFNDSLFQFMRKSLKNPHANTSFWSVGELMKTHLSEIHINAVRNLVLPNSIHQVTNLVTELLVEIEQQQQLGQAQELYIFYNQPLGKIRCAPCMQKVLPLDKQWHKQLSYTNWPTKTLPQLINSPQQSLKGLLHEYLFVSLFKACTASLASENASRLYAMQRAEKNISELQENLYRQYHQQRQSAVDAELFDLVGGFETLND